MNIIKKCPRDITSQIGEYIWGSRQIYSTKFTKILRDLPQSPLTVLNATDECRYKNKNWVELEDNVYCPACGEKSLWFAYSCIGISCDFCREVY